MLAPVSFGKDSCPDYSMLKIAGLRREAPAVNFWYTFDRSVQ
jgi:hypothetical protein